jgi:hypothetical protein
MRCIICKKNEKTYIAKPKYRSEGLNMYDESDDRRRLIFIFAIIVVVVVAVITVVAYLAYEASSTKPQEVMVSGTVTTVGMGTKPLEIKFTNVHNENDFYQINCVGGGNPASYQISLPNQKSYTVSIKWQGVLFNTGDTDVGNLNVDTYDSSLTHDWSG